MSDGVFIQFVCQFFNLMVIQIKVCQRFVCKVFVDSPHSSNEDHVKLDFPISLSIYMRSAEADSQLLLQKKRAFTPELIEGRRRKFHW